MPGIVDAPQVIDPAFLRGGGEAARLIRDHDWSRNLGPIAAWPQSLKSTVGLMVHSPVPMALLWGEDGIMLYNDAYAIVAGGRHPNLLGSKVREGWPEVADFNDNVMRVGLAGGVLSYKDQELTLYRSGRGEPVWMNLDYSPVFDESGRPGGVIAVVVETTERVLAERRDAALSTRLRAQFDQAPGFVIIMTGPDHVVEFVNESHRRIFGSEAWTGRSIREAFPSIEGQGFFEALDRVFGDGETVQFDAQEVHFRRGDGDVETHNLTFIYAPIHDASGKIAGIFCQGVDVTEAHRTMAALEESEARLRALFDSMDEGVMVIEQLATPPGALRDYRHVMMNDRAGVMLGKPDLTGSTIRQHWPDEGEFWYDMYDRVARTGEPMRFVHESVPQAMVIEMFLSRVGGEDSRRVMVVMQNITDRRRAEQMLADLNNTLERRVEERTRQLMEAEAALRQAQKMEAVGQLTGGIAHDFNNLLMGIGGSLEMIERRTAEQRPADARRYITAAIQATERATALTQRLLAFSRRQTLDPKPTDTNRLIEGMTELIQRSVGPDVEIGARLQESVWTTRVDPVQLESALLNLCINARDAMAPNGGEIVIATANTGLEARAASLLDLAAGDYVVVSVADKGAGMSSDVLTRVFEPFYTTKPLGQGTGLGLSMVYGFARQSGGQVRIESTVGAGTTVSLYLPRFEGAPELRADPAAVAIELGRGERVLVVDDDLTVRGLIHDQLTERGYRISESERAGEALALLDADEAVDLLITDVGLPGGMNGRQLADMARVRRPDLKVLFITGYAETAVIDAQGLGEHMAVLTKPFTLAQLDERVARLLRG